MSKKLGTTQADALQSQLVFELKEALGRVRIGEQFPVLPSDEICSSLEFFLPQLLRGHYSKWRTESLDGIFVARALKTSTIAAQLVGTCILISDQTVTPFMLDIGLSATGDSVGTVRLLLGEPGTGTLGVSGPPCNSREAQRLLATLTDRIDRIAWVFVVEQGKEE
jgi:hypothetical protein